MALSPEQARRFYDRFGTRQDSQGFYEDAALEQLAAHAAFEASSAVLELGCGTGRFAARLLETGGKLCLVSLTHGVTSVSRTVIALWSTVFRLNPSLVGGCRPVALEPLLDRTQWAVEHREVITSFGMPSEVVVASKK